MKATEKIKKITESILSSQKNLPLLSQLIELCQSTNSSTAHHAITSTAHVFGYIRVTLKNEDSESQKKINQWLNESFKLFITYLFTSFSNTDSVRQISSFNALNSILKTESKRRSEIQWSFDVQLFQKIIESFILNTENQCVDNFVQLISSHHDLRYYFYKSITPSFIALIGDSKLIDFLVDVLLTISTPTLDEECCVLFNDYCPLPEEHPISILKEHKVVFTECWLATLRSNFISPTCLKKILLVIDDRIIPNMTRPTLLIDFLTDSYNHGGVISLLSLNGLFNLIQFHNLDYPHFYTRLYSLIDESIFHVKYRSRFFRLLETFLSSAVLSSHMIASFIKKMSRFALYAPPTGPLIVLPFIYNLFRRHPSCIKMIHQTDCEPSYDYSSEPFTDAYNISELDPEKSNAMDSYLWELVTFKQHYHPSVASLAKIFDEPLTKPSYDLQDFLDLSYDSLFEKDKKIKRDVVPGLGYLKCDLIVSDDVFVI